MLQSDFKRILRCFAENPDAFDLSKGELLVQVRDDLIQARVVAEEGELFVMEGGERFPATQWLITRVARLPLLAERILSYVPAEDHFISPSAEFLPVSTDASADAETFVRDGQSTVQGFFNSREVGTTSVLYLTSDAGEGKTTLINAVARSQARAYKERTAKWLLLPITLGGRAFQRLDDIVAGSLMNKYRFQLLYYDGLLELVKLGVVVPAFDGFEEMFIESATGEALSALGNLIRALGSSGGVLVAARKAYFDYRNFSTQARLFDAMGGESVAFGRLQLKRWDKMQFETYTRARGLANPDRLFSAVAARFKETHPLLTRAVLVKRLADVASSGESMDTLVTSFGERPEDYFYQFVNAIVERDARDKWVDRSGATDVAAPLLSVREHHELLQMLALEMWLAHSEALKIQTLELLADLFCETRGKTPAAARQIRERLKQHALLVGVDGSGSQQMAFDHEDFRKFFLGEALGASLVAKDEGDIRRALQVAALPIDAAEAAAHFVEREGGDMRAALRRVVEMGARELPSSFLKENCGLLSLVLARNCEDAGLVMQRLSFPGDALKGKALRRAVFEDCHFQATSLEGTQLVGCEFRRCRFERIELRREQVLEAKLVECEVDSVHVLETDEYAFAPARIAVLLGDAGFSVPQAAGKTFERSVSDDVKLIARAVRIFLRNTQLNESVLRQKLSTRANHFVDHLLPSLMAAGVFEEVPYHGAGQQRRFRLASPMTRIQAALGESDGSLEGFLAEMKRR